MTVEFTDQMETIDWARLALDFERAPLGSRDPAQLQRAFGHSQVRCFVWDAGALVGAGRALTDSVWNSMIFDVVLLPDYQRKGLGKEIMKFLADRTTAQKVLLYAVPGKEGFYAKLGFRKMKTAMIRYSTAKLEQRHHELGYVE